MADRASLIVRSLTAEQQVLVETMRQHQFGRIENLRIRDGQPVVADLRVVRISRLGAAALKAPPAGDFELKRAVTDLLDELERIGNGIVVRLEFRHGLPFLLETSLN